MISRCWILCICLFAAACTGDRAELGSVENPVKFYFTPSVDAQLMEDSSKLFKVYLEKNTPYKFEFAIPQSFIAVVEAFGTKRADIAAVNSYGYLLARRKYGVEARLTFVRQGELTYRAQFLAKSQGSITKLSDFAGKKIAFVDPASASGYLLPKKILRDKGIKPKDEVFAMKHDSVVTMIYQGQVDGGATYYSPPIKGEIQDARRLVRTQYPDIEKKVVIVELTDPIPNDPIVFRKDLPEEIKSNVSNALIQFAKTSEGKSALDKVYGAEDLRAATDKDYLPMREMLESLETEANQKSQK